MSIEFDAATGELLRWEDDDTRTVKVYDPPGTLALTVPYTAEQDAAADARAAQAVQDANEATVRSATASRLAELDTEIIKKSNAELFTQSGTGAALKLLARTLRLVIRILIRRFDAAD